jgi:hypothetical protein
MAKIIGTPWVDHFSGTAGADLISGISHRERKSVRMDNAGELAAAHEIVTVAAL